MKITKAELQEMIKESIYVEMVSLAQEQKQLAEYFNIYLEETPFLQEHRNLKSKEALLEFFGPFKRLKTADLAKMSQDKETKAAGKAASGEKRKYANLAKATEGARKKLSSLKLTDVAAMEVALEAYVESLVDLYQGMKGADLDANLKSQLSKPFAAAAYTLQNLSTSLADAANDLFSAVPRSSGVYSAGQEAADIETQQKSFMRTPGQQLKQAAKDVWAGLGGPPGGGTRGGPPPA
jgi:hypothetical protein